MPIPALLLFCVNGIMKSSIIFLIGTPEEIHFLDTFNTWRVPVILSDDQIPTKELFIQDIINNKMTHFCLVERWEQICCSMLWRPVISCVERLIDPLEVRGSMWADVNRLSRGCRTRNSILLNSELRSEDVELANDILSSDRAYYQAIENTVKQGNDKFNDSRFQGSMDLLMAIKMSNLPASNTRLIRYPKDRPLL